MFGVLGGLTTPPNTDWGEQMLNAVASQAIRHLFTRSDAVEVRVRCYPSNKLLQGSIDSFRMQGRGLVIRKEFEVEEMSFETDAVMVDFGAVLGGSLRLQQSTQAVAQVTLSEAGINRAFQAELVKCRLVNLMLPELMNLAGGEPVSFYDVKVKLLPDNRVQILAYTDLPNCQALPVSMTATLGIERRRRIVFQAPQFESEPVPAKVQGLSEAVTMVFAEILNHMVDLDRFDLDGIQLRLNRLETQGQKLLFSGYAQIDHFPNRG